MTDRTLHLTPNEYVVLGAVRELGAVGRLLRRRAYRGARVGSVGPWISTCVNKRAHGGRDGLGPPFFSPSPA
jgi:hypothetical protein